jgi:hypothetical protein
MRTLVLSTALLTLLLPVTAEAAAIPCSDLPMAEGFVQKLRPGPNTRAAQQHLEAAKAATSQEACSAELRQVDKYAKRSVAADRRAGHHRRGYNRSPHA